MIRIITTYLVVALVLVSNTSALAEPSSWYGEWVLPSSDIVERERVTIGLDIFSVNPMIGQIEVETFSMQDVFVEKPNLAPIYFTKVVRGERYQAARINYDLYIGRNGLFTIPELAVTISRQGKLQSQFRIDSQEFEVKELPFEAHNLISTSELSLSQSTSTTTIVAGGVIERNIKLSVANLPGYLIAELPASQHIDGVEVFLGRTTTSMNAYGGELTGVRNTQRHYRLQEAGNYLLPAMDILWWDNTEKITKTSSIDAIEITVLPPPPLPLKQQLSQWKSNSINLIKEGWASYQRFLIIMTFMIAIVWFSRHVIHRYAMRFVTKISSWCDNPTIAFIKLLFIVCITSDKQVKKLLWQKQAFFNKHKEPKDVQIQALSLESKKDVIVMIYRCILRKQIARFSLKPLN